MANAVTKRGTWAGISLLVATLMPHVTPALATMTIPAGTTRQITQPVHIWVVNNGNALSVGDLEIRGDITNTFFGDGANVLNNPGATFTVHSGTLTFHSESQFMFGTGNVRTGELQNHGTFKINENAAVRNNYGTMYNGSDGVINNYGALYSNEAGSMIQNCGTINNYGYLECKGQLAMEDGGYLNNQSGGQLILTGYIRDPYGSYGTIINAPGGFMQLGSPTVRDASTYGDLMFYNQGTFHNYAEFGSPIFVNAGYFWNTGGSSVNLNDFGNATGASVRNESTFYCVSAHNNAGARFENLSSFGTIGTLTNAGTIENSGALWAGTLDNLPGGTLVMYPHGMYGPDTGIINNSGTIKVECEYTLGGQNSGTLNLKADGTLENNGTIINPADHTQANAGTILNHGVMTNAGAITGGGTYIQTDFRTTNTGTFHQASIAIQGGSFEQQAGSLEATIITNAGTFNFAGGAVMVDSFTNSGIFKGAGTISPLAAGSVAFTNSGTVAPGFSPGMLTITGDYTQTDSGLLVVEFGGLTQGTEYDFLNITGTASLAGILDVDLWNGFTPTLGEEFNILHAGAVSGTFDAVSLPTLANGLLWDVSYTGTDVCLRVVPEPATVLLLGFGLIGLAGRGKRAGK